MEWIKTSERMPKHNTPVLAYSPAISDGSMDVSVFDSGTWWTPHGGYGSDMITHWMELPPPPET